MKMPKTLGACADMLYALREKRLEAQKAVDAMQAEETALKEHIINQLPKSDASGVSGKVARVAVSTREIPRVEDWEKFHEYVRKTKQFDLLQRRAADAAVKERWEAGEQIPGVGRFTVVTVSVNKV